MLERVRLWLRSVVRRRRLERDMREEMAEHLERSTERLMARGLSPEEARRAALREFGNVTYHQEQAREARGTAWLDALAADVRFALRHFARTPGTTVVMLVVLAVGMSISTLLFSYVHSYAVQPPPGIALEDDLVRIRGSRSAGVDGRGYRIFSEEELFAYRELTDHFRAVAGWTDQQVLLDAGAEAGRRWLQARVTFVTRNYFSVIGVQPMLGAGLQGSRSGDAPMAAVAVIGHTAWDLLFGRSPDVIGSSVAVNGVPVTVVGVAPESFDGWPGYSTFQLWMPLPARDLLMSEPSGGFRAAGRLRAGVSHQEATAAARVVAARFAADGTDDEDRALDPSTEVVPLLSANGDPMFERDVRLMSVSMGLLGLLVLLVTCTNVSSLLTGLATARRQEMAVRLSMGAERARLIRQLLTESAMLACVAAAAALALVSLVLGAVNERIPAIPLEFGVDWAATTFTFGIALAVGVLFGLSPALHATRLAVASALRDSAATAGAARASLQRGLVVAQVAFTQPPIVLLAAVLLLTLGRFQPQSRTPVPDRVVALSLRFLVPPSAEAAPETGQRLRVATRRLVDRLEDTPGVEAVVPSWRSTSALGSYYVHPNDAMPGAPRDAVPLTVERVDEGYFDIMAIPVVRGRTFTSYDVDAMAPGAVELPVVIGDDLARRLWAGADPIGRRLRAASDTATAASTLVVVGVVDDPLAEAREAGQDYQVYLPPGADWVTSEVLLRTAGPAEPLLPDIRRIAQEEAPGMAADVGTLARSQAFERHWRRLVTSGISVAGLLALLLSAIGLYAVVAFSVNQRSGEIAVRMAMGARGGQVVGRFVGDGLRLGALGLLFGLPASLVGLRLLMTVPDIPEVGLPPVTAIAAVGVVVVAAAAAWVPARRAASVDPAVVLRGE